uniref:50S ribosomal protein L11 methyltransferase n=1 Tax=Saccharothrix mutabilis TaxID=33921 RepID=UPI0031D67223
MRFGQRLWIVPSWHAAPEPDAVNLLLDPGLAFGTGTHPTTALCLEWLDGQDLKDCNVLDFGCGSGIPHRALARDGCRCGIHRQTHRAQCRSAVHRPLYPPGTH